MARRPHGAMAPNKAGPIVEDQTEKHTPASESGPSVAIGSAPEGRLVFLSPDWLPVALLVGDAVIAAASVPAGYWIKYANATQALPFGPYLAAIPIVVVLYLFSLAATGQYRSWRGRTLVDQLFALYSGVGLAPGLMLSAFSAPTVRHSPS